MIYSFLRSPKCCLWFWQWVWLCLRVLRPCLSLLLSLNALYLTILFSIQNTYYEPRSHFLSSDKAKQSNCKLPSIGLCFVYHTFQLCRPWSAFRIHIILFHSFHLFFIVESYTYNLTISTRVRPLIWAVFKPNH